MSANKNIKNTENTENTENNALVTINGGNAISVLSTALASVADKLGYKTNTIEVDDEGKALVPVYSSDEKCVIEKRVKMPENIRKSINEINALGTLDDIKGVYLAKAIYELATFAENNGYNSVGKFVSEMIPRIKANYANQLYNVAKSFLSIAEDGTPSWKYDFCEGVCVSNLALLMPLVNKSGSVEQFITDYIDTDKIHPDKAQNKLKDELSTLSGNGTSKKSGKKSGKKSDNDSDSDNKLDAYTAWALVRTKLLETTLTDDNANEMKSTSVAFIDAVMSALQESEKDSEQESEKDSEQETK